ncbi:MAG: CHAT domain-containing protein [Coleofasciculaceae cyanobacterium]
MAQEFHISVTSLRERDEYLVRIEKVATGVQLAEERVIWPVEDWLIQAQQLMNDPLMGVLQGNASFPRDGYYSPATDNQISRSSRNLEELGKQLYEALFYKSLRDSWIMAQAIAQNQHQVLRLRLGLGLKEPRLSRLPWEVLHGGDRPLATGTDIVFSRYQLSTRPNKPIDLPSVKATQPLKILMVIAGPSDKESLELAREASQLQAELASRSPHEPPAIELTLLEQPGSEQLTQALEQGRYQVFHYAGHSNLGDSGGDLYLVDNTTGLAETLKGKDLAGLLVNNGVQLAVFNSCRGAYTAAAEFPGKSGEQNLAEAVVKRGIPGVLAMAERIPDKVALTLTRLLYRNLNQGYPIDLSLSRARQGLISAYGSNQLYWALPVLYLHSEFNGFLTDINHADYSRAVFALPDPPETQLASNQQEPLFTPPPINPKKLAEVEAESAIVSSETKDSYEGEEPFDDLDSNITDAEFIQGLLRELNAEPTNVQISEVENSTEEESEAASSELVQDSANNNSSVSKGAVIDSSATLNSQLKTEVDDLNQSAQKRNQEQTRENKTWWHQLGIPRLWLGLGITALVLLSLFSFWQIDKRQLKQGNLPSTPSPTKPESQELNLKTADTKTVTGIAIEKVTQGNITYGQNAIEALLNRGALPSAVAVLDTIPPSQINEPTVSFLKGRLAWQYVQAGNEDYSVDDARRFWVIAHKQQPESWTYLNALGFAYYAEGDFQRANNAWFEAMRRIQTEDEATEDAATSAKETLSTYAGLALGLWKSSQDLELSADKQESLLKESLKFRNKVMADDPINFQPDALSKNWLWSEQTIQDWRSLLAISN